MKNLLLPVLLFSLCQFALGQKVEWVKNIKTLGVSNTATVSLQYTDQNGDVIIGGYFNGSIDVDFSENDKILTRESAGEDDYSYSFFFARYDKELNLKWANVLANDHSIGAYDISKGKNDSIYITGYFDSTTDFDPSESGNTTLTSSKWMNTASDIFIAKYDKNGKFGSVAVLVTSQSSAYFKDISIHVDTLNGKLYLNGVYTGYGSAPLDFNPSSATTNLSTANSASFFLASYTLTPLSLNWVKLIDHTVTVSFNTVMLNDLTSDAAGNIYFNGNLYGTYDFDPSSGVTSLEQGTGSPSFIAKFSSAGALTWVYKFETAGSVRMYEMEIDANNNLYLGGVAGGVSDLDPSSSTFNVSSSGVQTGFLAKYKTSDCSLVWAKIFAKIAGGPDPSFVTSQALKLNESKNVLYVAGKFYGDVDFDFSANVKKLSSKGETDMFLAAYDLNGNYISAISAGNDYYDENFSLTIDTKGNLYTVGQIFNVVVFDPYWPEYSIGNSGITQNYFGKFAPFGVSGPLNFEICDGETANLLGLATGDTTATYQWYMSTDKLDDETKPNLIINNVALSDEGNYSLVVISSKFGKDTLVVSLNYRTSQECITGILSEAKTSQFEVYPNPTKDLVKIKSSSAESVKSVSVYGNTGMEMIKAEGNNDNELLIDISSLNPGIYYFRINAQAGTGLKIIKE